MEKKNLLPKNIQAFLFNTSKKKSTQLGYKEIQSQHRSPQEMQLKELGSNKSK